jgi:hypothetical protein
MTALPPAWQRLRTPLIISVLMLLSGIGLVWESRQLLVTTGQTARMAATRLAATEDSLRQAQETDRLTRNALTDYAALQKAGLQQPVDRVAWQENLQATRKALQMGVFSYEIGAERPLTLFGDAPDNKPTIFASTLHLRTELRHEDAFLALIHALQQPGKALRPTRCTLSRQASTAQAPGLAASCDIDWISLRIKGPDVKMAPQGAIFKNEPAIRNDSRR